MSDDLQRMSQAVGAALSARQWRIATAESCTGGGVAAAITLTPGSSSWFEYGFVSYANNAKQALLGVSPATLVAEGAVSEAVVTEMVAGALQVAEADIAVAISGIAGPGGGSDAKPVGTVWFCWGSADGQRITACKYFAGDRVEVQSRAVVTALEGVLAFLEKKPV